METAFKVFRFVHGYVIIFEFKIFATSKFRALREKNVTKIRNARSEDAEKTDYFLYSSTVYENVLPKLISSPSS